MTDFIRLSDAAELVVCDGIAYLVDDEALEFEGANEDVLRALKLLGDGCARADVEAILGHGRSAELLDLLESEGLLRRFALDPESRHAAQIRYFDGIVDDADAAQERLDRAHVVVLGVGGVGSLLLEHLGAAGVSRFTLIDGDRVASSNFNRQFLYARDDLGEPACYDDVGTR